MSNSRVSHLKYRASLVKTVASLAAACLAWLALANTARAQETDPADCKVFEIKASNGNGGIDAKLKPLEAKLKKPPFSAWKSFEVVKSHTTKAPHMKPVTVELVSGGKLGLLYKERSDSKGHKTRLRVGMTLDDASGKRKADITLKVDSGDFSLLGRNAEKEGSSHVLAISCSVK